MARTGLFFWLNRQMKRAMQHVDMNERNQHNEDLAHVSKITKTPVTRRDFLKGAAGMAAVGLAASPTLQALAALPSPTKPPNSLKPDHIHPVLPAQTSSQQPVVIIGGGLTGLATAYHLSKQQVPCVVYEASSRLGGRMFTKDNFNAEGMFVELGGELIDTNHEEILQLCKELSVPTEAFEPFDKGLEPAIYFSGGMVHEFDEVEAAFMPLAKQLAADIKKCFPDGAIDIPTYQQPYQTAELDKLSLESYLDAQTEVAPWLIRLIKTAYTGEYGRDPAEQSALNLLLLVGLPTFPSAVTMAGMADNAEETVTESENASAPDETASDDNTPTTGDGNAPSITNTAIDSAEAVETEKNPEEKDAETPPLEPDTFRMYGESDEAMRIQGGNSHLIEALIKALGKAQVPIHTGYALTHIAERNGELQLRFQTGDGRKTPTFTRQSARRVVLAMPFSVLRTVRGVAELPLSPVKKRCIQEWGYGTNSKLMVGFKSRFWRDPEKVDATTSYRPLHQKPIPANTGEVFSDTKSQCIWETSRLQTGNAGILTNFLGGQTGQAAKEGQLGQFMADLSLLYPQARSYLDDNRALMNWHAYKWNRGSYTCPAPGQYTTLMGVAGEPELNGRLLFAGEHCSIPWAGFMNGAAHSALLASEHVLKSNEVAQLCSS
jgi:monoamine oxidase